MTHGITHLRLTGQFRQIAVVLAGVIVLVIFISLLVSLLRSRRHKANEKKNFHERVSTEIMWALIPFVMLLILSIPAVHLILKKTATASNQTTIKQVNTR